MRRIKLARRLQRISEFLPKQYPVKSVKPLESQPFFIFGSGRNGSTLLNRILNQHPELFLPSEQYFLGDCIIKFRLYNFLNWRDLVKVIAGELLYATGSHTWDFSLEEIFNDLNEMEARSLQSVIDMIYRAYASKYKSFSTWGDTTPPNTFYINEIYNVFPKAQYIFLLRDGRDVVASYKKGGRYLGDLCEPENAAEHWLKSIEKYEWLNKRANVLLVKYEDLVSNPELKLKQICSHLDIEFHKRLLQFHINPFQNALYLEPQHRNLVKPVFQSSIGNYQKELGLDEISKISRIMNTYLTRFDYQ